jgi:hypothetical protein
LGFTFDLDGKSGAAAPVGTVAASAVHDNIALAKTTADRHFTEKIMIGRRDPKKDAR